jgi:integrase
MITQQIIQVGWKIEIGDPKTETGERAVSLDAASVEVLRGWREQQNAERALCGAAWREHGLVFAREDVGPLQPDTVSDTFHQIADGAGLPPIRLHDLRHTAASLAPRPGCR